MTTVEAKPTDSTVVADVIENIETVMVGKHDVVVQAVAALLAGGHVLVEDVPGVGKTMLAKAVALSVGGEFKRIQFTADLLPSDVTGVSIFHERTSEFRFRPGPLFSNVLLGDEINRATPRTQSSLLEAMEEEQATVDGVRHPVPRPFFVIATQNPIELEGTYPLPFAQMDRFIVKLRLGYLSHALERRMIKLRIRATPIASLQPVISCTDLVALQEQVRNVAITDELLDYVVALVQHTRVADGVEFGASPRASLDLMHYAQAMAFIRGREYVLPDDIKGAVVSVLGHRLIVRRGTRHAVVNSDGILADVLSTVEVPV